MNKLQKKLTKSVLTMGAAGLVFAAAPAAAAGKRHDVRQQPDAPVITPENQKQYQVGTTWVLKSFNDKPVPIKEELTFTIDSSYRGYGFSGCNTWSATVYPVKNQRFMVGPVAITHNQCDKEKSQFETTYLTFVHANPSWDLDGGDLVMRGQFGTMRFQRSL